MSLRDLSVADFEFYKKYYDDMKDVHEKEFLSIIDPELMRAFYRGRRNKEKRGGGHVNVHADPPASLISLTKIFNSSNTVLPNLYYQNPKKLAFPTRGANPVSGALMTAVQNYYMKALGQKSQNQEAIMNAWFFGLGWKKVGYHTAMQPRVTNPETKMNFQDKAMMGVKSVHC